MAFGSFAFAASANASPAASLAGIGDQAPASVEQVGYYWKRHYYKPYYKHHYWHHKHYGYGHGYGWKKRHYYYRPYWYKHY